MYKTLDFHVRGVAPLLMHNGQLANPFNPFTKAMKVITAKRKKSEDDMIELANIEFMGGLYTNEDGRPVLPGELIEATLINGAKKTRRGNDAKSALIVQDNAVLDYEGPKKPEALRDDPRFRHTALVTIGKNKILRTRPIFKRWEAKFTVHYLPDTFNEAEVVDFVETAGRVCCFGDGRPRYGRFEIVSHSAAA